MKEVIEKFRIGGVWHFTDSSNLPSIGKEQALLSYRELQRRGIQIPAPGGNQWSHDADVGNSVDDYVHLAFLDDHPMLYRARQEGRIPNPVWFQIDSSVLLEPGVRFCSEVANKSGAKILTAEEAVKAIDFAALFTYMDWRDPDVRARRQAAVKSEILVPKQVSIKLIRSYKNG